MYIVIFHYDIPPLSYWLQLTDRNFILQGRFIKSFKDSSLKLYRTPGLTRGFLYTKKRLMLLSATETLLYDDSLESRMTHRSVGSSPAGSVYHLYGAIWQCHQVLHKVVVHALSDLDAMCNEIIDRLPFQATWCCKCIIKRYLLEPQYAANRFA